MKSPERPQISVEQHESGKVFDPNDKEHIADLATRFEKNNNDNNKDKNIETEINPNQKVFQEVFANLRRVEGIRQEAVNVAAVRLEQLKEKLGDVDIENNPPLRGKYLSFLSREYALLQQKNIIEFARVPNDQDIAYRLDVYDKWPQSIAEKVPAHLPLRFHGCPIYTARSIFDTGGLSASADRLGFDTSYDVAGQVSVSTSENVAITIQSYTDLTSERCVVPAGVVFVLLPKDEVDAASAGSLLMGNVSFKEEPERLYAVVSTPENMDRLKVWAREVGVSESKIETFDSFLKRF